MSGFIVGADRSRATLFPERLDDYVAEEGAVRVIDVFVDELDLLSLGFKTEPADTGRPGYHPAMMRNGVLWANPFPNAKSLVETRLSGRLHINSQILVARARFVR